MEFKFRIYFWHFQVKSEFIQNQFLARLLFIISCAFVFCCNKEMQCVFFSILINRKTSTAQRSPPLNVTINDNSPLVYNGCPQLSRYPQSREGLLMLRLPVYSRFLRTSCPNGYIFSEGPDPSILIPS